MRKQNDKVVAGILLAAMSAGMLAACTDKTPVEQPQTETINTPNDTQELETTKIKDNSQQSSEEEIPDVYEKILEEYKTMMAEKWDLEKISEENLCTLAGAFYDDNAAAYTGYLLYDLNGDNQPELLIGETNTTEVVNRMIFDAYTIKDGAAQQLFVSHERNRYYLTEDEAGACIIANEGSNGAANSGWTYYTLGEDGLQVVQAVICDGLADEEHPWFLAHDDDWDVTNDEAIDEQTAQDIIDSYTQNYAKLDWIPFGE